ncbi:MAG: LUD domain-containing protein [Candidatus Levybacteria bacterium]|nr:LUD domain-containing protein [Candidatus Levybacteria bacterium]
MKDFSQLENKKVIEKTIKALRKNGIEAEVVENSEMAKKRIYELIPEGSEVMIMSSVTLIKTGIAKELNESGRYDSVKKKLASMNRKTQGIEMQRIGGAPQYALGSVHAVTQDGRLLIASNTGSQLGAYTYGSEHVIWVVGAQKIVEDLDEGMKRVYEYVLPLESERMKRLYNMPSNVSKLLIFNKEIVPNRVRLIFINEKIGY